MTDIWESDAIFIDFKDDTSNLGLDVQVHQNDTLTLNFMCTNDGIIEDMTKYHVELRVHNNNSNTDYIQTQNENIVLGEDGSVKILCESLKGNKLTAYSGYAYGVLRVFNIQNKQKATRIIKIKIKDDPIGQTTICESTITKLEELDWLLNEIYNIEDELRKSIEEAIIKKNELIKTTEIANTTNTTLVENIGAGDTLNRNLVTNINEGKTINTTLVTNTNIANEKITTLNGINTNATKNITDLTEQNTNATKNITDLTKQNDDALTNKSELSNILIDATNKITEVESIISNATGKITEVETSINNAAQSKKKLDTSNTTAGENIKDLTEKNATAEILDNNLDKNIKYGSKLSEDLKENITTGTKVNEVLDKIVPKALKTKDDLISINDLSIKTKDDLTQLNTEALKTKDDLVAENIKADEKIEAMKNIDPANVVQDVTDIKKEVNDARGSYSNLNERLTNIIGKDVANLYVSDTEPELDGLWVDTDGVGEVGSNDLLDDVKKYVDNDIKPIIGKIDVENDGDMASQLKEKANLKDVKIFNSLEEIGLTVNDMTNDFSSNVLKIIKAMGANRRISLYPYQTESNTNLYNSLKTWCGFNTDAYQLYIDTSFNGADNLPSKIKIIPNYNDGNNKIFIGFFDNKLGVCKEIQFADDTGWIPLPLTGGAVPYNEYNKPHYRRHNGYVEIIGAVKGLKNINTANEIIFATLPVGFRCWRDICIVCQGSNREVWTLKVDSGGFLKACRYGTNTFASSLDGTEWLPFHIIYNGY